MEVDRVPSEISTKTTAQFTFELAHLAHELSCALNDIAAGALVCWHGAGCRASNLLPQNYEARNKLDPHDGARQNALRTGIVGYRACSARIAGRGVRASRPRGQRGRAGNPVVEIQKGHLYLGMRSMGRLKCLNFVPTVSARDGCLSLCGGGCTRSAYTWERL